MSEHENEQPAVEDAVEGEPGWDSLSEDDDEPADDTK